MPGETSNEQNKRQTKAMKAAALNNPTKGYAPGASFGGAFGYGLAALDGKPFYTWIDIPRMRRDPRVRLLASMWRSPFQQVQWEVKASNPKVQQYVDRTLRRFWRGSLPALLTRYFWYGYAPGGAEFELRNGIVRFVRVRAVEPMDARPELFKGGPHDGQMAGFSLNNAPGNPKVFLPHAFWFAGRKEIGRHYDMPPASGMFEPWAEKRERNGAVDTRRLWMWKNSSRGGVLRHPPGRGDATDENPTGRDYQDEARQIADYASANAVVTLSNEPNQGMVGKYAWEMEYPTTFPDRAGYLEYIQALDAEMCDGVEIPREVLEASETGSGYSGRLVPMLGWLNAADEMVGSVIEACEWLKYAVQINFGADQWFEVEPQPLAEKFKHDSKGGGGGAGGVPPPDNPQQPPGGGGLGGVPPGDPYSGKRGGNGYTNPQTGKVRYLGDMRSADYGSPVPRETRKRVKQILRGLHDRERFLLLSDGRTAPQPAAQPADPKARRKQLMILLAMLEFQRRAHAVNDPQSSAPYLAALSHYLKDHESLRYPLSLSWLPVELSWRADETKTGHVKAIGEADHAGRVLYGAKAEAALRNQNSLKSGEKPGERSKKVPEPHPNRDQWMKAGVRAREILTKFAAGQHSPEELSELQQHLPYLPMDRLGTARSILRTQFKGVRGRLGQVNALMDHIREQVGVMQQKDTEEPVLAAHLGDAATPGGPGAGPFERLAASHNDPEALQKHAQDLEIHDAIQAGHRGDAGPEIQGAVERGGKWENHNGSLVKKYAAIGKELATHFAKPKEEPKPTEAPAEPEKPVKVLKAKKQKGPELTGTLYATVRNYGGIDPKSLSFLAHYEGVNAAKENGISGGVFKDGGRGLDELVKELMATGHISADNEQEGAEKLLEGLANQGYSELADRTEHWNKLEEEYYRKLQEEEDAKRNDKSRIDAAVRAGEEAGHREAEDGAGEETRGRDEGDSGSVQEAPGHGEVDDSFDFGGNAKPKGEPAPEAKSPTPAKPAKVSPGLRQFNDELSDTFRVAGGSRIVHGGADAVAHIAKQFNAKPVNAGELFTTQLKKHAEEHEVPWATVENAVMGGDERDKRNLSVLSRAAWKDAAKQINDDDGKLVIHGLDDLHKYGIEEPLDDLHGTAIRGNERKGESMAVVVPEDSPVKAPHGRTAAKFPSESPDEPLESHIPAPPHDPFAAASTNHTPTIESIPAGQLGWVSGYQVRSIGDGKFQVETGKAYKTGTAAEVAGHINDAWRHAAAEKNPAESAMARAAHFPEPNWFGGGTAAEDALRRRGAVPAGARGVSLEPNTRGRLGIVTRDESGATHLKLDGGHELKATDFEPLEGKFSWRVPEQEKPAAKKEVQGELFGEKKPEVEQSAASNGRPVSDPLNIKELPVHDVPLDSLRSTQEHVDPAKVAAMETHGEKRTTVLNAAKQLQSGKHTVEAVRALQPHLESLSKADVANIAKELGYDRLATESKPKIIGKLIENLTGLAMSKQRSHLIQNPHEPYTPDEPPSYESRNLPPADVVRDGDGAHHIEDGHHRAAAEHAKGSETVPARVWEKGEEGFKAADKPVGQLVSSYGAGRVHVAQADDLEPAEEGGNDATAGPAPEVNDTTKELEKHRIEDFGEKIGGARKDDASPRGPRKSVMDKPADDRPGWARRYHVGQDAKSGKWFISDKRQKGYGGLLKGDYATKEAADAAVPLIEVARNHRVTTDPHTPGQFAIIRKISDRKIPTVKGGFASHDDAMKYMAKNPEEIIGHEFDFPSEVPHLDNVQRTGAEVRKGDIAPNDFQQSFGFRGGEFGNWNMGEHGQAALNHAYDAMHDLAGVLGVPPKAVSLNGQLAIAFGARGHGGKDAARAHYEREKKVINLTKIKGAGTLAHEWFHALDHHIGQMMGKTGNARDEAYASHGVPWNTKARKEVVDAFKNVIGTMTAKTVDMPLEEGREEKHMGYLKKQIADDLGSIAERFRMDMQYGKRKKPFTPEQQAEWDGLLDKIKAGGFGKKVFVEGAGRNQFGGYESYENLQSLNALYKKATGRSFISAEPQSYGRRIAAHAKSIEDAAKRIGQAKEGASEQKKRGTDYLHQAKKIDSHRLSDYWSSPHEMAARAFESYVNDKIKEQKNRSDYLTYGSRNHALNSTLGKPYPEGEERDAINKAFDKLLATLDPSDFHGELAKPGA